MKYEFYNDLKYDYLKYLEDLSHEDQSESNSTITFSSYSDLIESRNEK